MKKASPFLILGDMAVDELERKVNHALKQLYPHWLSESDQFIFTVINRNKSLAIDNKNWDIYGSSETVWVAFKKDEKVKNKILKEIFELDQYASIKSTKLTDAVYQDFINSNISAIFDIDDAKSAAVKEKMAVTSGFGSGAVIGNILYGSINIPIAISGAVIMGICTEFKQKLKEASKAQSQLSARESLLGELKAKLEVTAGKVKISFDDFSNMEVGDVVLLDSKVGEPFNANLSNDVQSNVQLCRLGNQKAIQFIE